MVIATLAGAWVDERLDASPAPAMVRDMGLTGADGTWPAAMIVLPVAVVLAVLAARELAAMLREKGVATPTMLTAAYAVVGVLLTGVLPDHGSSMLGGASMGTAVGLVIACAMVYHARARQVEGVVAAAGGGLLALGSIGVLLGFLVLLRREHSAWVLCWVIVVTKMSDVGAFFTGRLLGRTLLAPWLSPGKTVEGLIGGVITAMVAGIAGVGVLRVLPGDAGVTLWFGVIGAAGFALLGQAGDLMASLIKRDTGRKDAGGSVPGFGGVIDVLDSLLPVLPAAFWLLALTQAA